MENNLYNKIKSLTARKNEITQESKKILYDATKQEQLTKLIEEYNIIEATLTFISQKCVISPKKIEDLISNKEGSKYNLKIFREVEYNEEVSFHTGNFIVCYLNKDNRYFNYNSNGLSFINLLSNKSDKYVNYDLNKEDYEKLLKTLEETKSYVLVSNKDIEKSILISPPCVFLENVNLIRMFTKNVCDVFVNIDFQNEMYYEIKKYLENIDADEFLKKDNKNVDNEETKE